MSLIETPLLEVGRDRPGIVVASARGMINRVVSQTTVASVRTFRAIALGGLLLGVLGASSFGSLGPHAAVVSEDPESAEVESIGPTAALTVVDFAPTLITVER